jgi:Sec-independent protein translocase protein TatA
MRSRPRFVAQVDKCGTTDLRDDVSCSIYGGISIFLSAEPLERQVRLTGLLLLLLLTFLLLGPKKTSELTRQLGKHVGNLKRATEDLQAQIAIDIPSLPASTSAGSNTNSLFELVTSGAFIPENEQVASEPRVVQSSMSCEGGHADESPNQGLNVPPNEATGSKFTPKTADRRGLPEF